MISIHTPITEAAIEELNVGDMIAISGKVYAGRDAVLPRLVSLIERGQIPLC